MDVKLGAMVYDLILETHVHAWVQTSFGGVYLNLVEECHQTGVRNADASDLSESQTHSCRKASSKSRMKIVTANIAAYSDQTIVFHSFPLL